MPFDPWRYEQEFLRPLRGRHDQLRLSDPVARYALPEAPTPVALRAHLDEIRGYWRSRADGPDSYAELCRILLIEDERMRGSVGDSSLSDPEWWDRVARDARPAVSETNVSAIPPPTALTASASGATVILEWRAGTPMGAGVRYRVVRGEGHVPRHPQDGVHVATTRDPHAVDATPPVAAPVYYAVFAIGEEGGYWSGPATAQTQVLPPVTGISHERDVGRISARWHTNPSTVEASVRRTEGRPPVSAIDGQLVVASLTSFEDRDVRPDVDYFYSVAAVYRSHEGPEPAPMVVIAVPGDTTPRPAPDLRLAVKVLDMRGDVTRVRLTWPEAGGAEIRVRRGGRAAPWRAGERVSPADLDRYGEEVVGQRSTHDGQRVLEADVPAGYHVYVPFAVGTDGVLVGRSAAVGTAEPISHVHARRSGGKVLLSWRWPQPNGFVEAIWETPTGVVSQRVSKAEYDIHGEFRLPFGRAAGEIRLRLITQTAGGPAVSPTASVHIGALPVRLAYRLRQERRRVTVELTADVDCSDVRVLLVVSSGRALPARPDQGVIVKELAGLSLTADVMRPFTVTLPPTIRPPGWIRCFDGATVAMIDPPIDNMRLR